MNMYGNNNNYYTQDLQALRDKVDRQLQQAQQMQQMQQIQNQYPQAQQPQINQTFQLASNQIGNDTESRFVDNIEEVKRIFVMKTGVFPNRDFTMLWVKDVSGKIKTYRLEEVEDLDDKDKTILALQKQINELREEIRNEHNESDVADTDEQITESKPKNVRTNKSSNTK